MAVGILDERPRRSDDNGPFLWKLFLVEVDLASGSEVRRTHITDEAEQVRLQRTEGGLVVAVQGKRVFDVYWLAVDNGSVRAQTRISSPDVLKATFPLEVFFKTVGSDLYMQRWGDEDRWRILGPDLKVHGKPVSIPEETKPPVDVMVEGEPTSRSVCTGLTSSGVDDRRPSMASSSRRRTPAAAGRRRGSSSAIPASAREARAATCLTTPSSPPRPPPAWPPRLRAAAPRSPRS